MRCGETPALSRRRLNSGFGLLREAKADACGLSVRPAAKASASPGNNKPWLHTPTDCACEDDPGSCCTSGNQTASGEPRLRSSLWARGAEPGVGPEAGGPLRDQAKCKGRPRARVPGQDPCEPEG